MSDADRRKWDARYAEPRVDRDAPSRFLLSVSPLLPTEGLALDVAGGAGRHAVWLAKRGLDVLLIDVSEVGLAHARAMARGAGVEIATTAIDLEVTPLPAGPWDLVLSFHYLRRELFAEWARVLAPGGLLVYTQPTERNLTRHDRPPREFLLGDGRAPRADGRDRARRDPVRRRLARRRPPRSAARRAEVTVDAATTAVSHSSGSTGSVRGPKSPKFWLHGAVATTSVGLPSPVVVRMVPTWEHRMPGRA